MVYNNMLKQNLELFSALNKSEVVYCQFKSTDHIEAGLNGETDLDLLVSFQNYDHFQSIVKLHNFKQTKAGFGSSDKSREGFLGYDSDTGKFIYLDVHYTVIIGRDRVRELHSIRLSNKILERRMLHDQFPIYVPNKNDEASLLFLRIVMKFTFLKLLRRMFFGAKYWCEWDQELDFLMSTGNSLSYSLDDELEFKNTFEHFISKKLQVRHLMRAKTMIKKRYVFKHTLFGVLFVALAKLAFASISHFTRRYQVLNHIFVRKVTPNFAPLVVFIGVDGAGKSTQLKQVTDVFSWKLDTHLTYLGAGQGKLTWPLMLMKQVKQMIDPYRTRRKLKAISTVSNDKISIFKVIWAFALMRDKQKKLKKIQRLRAAGVTVFTDRFPQTHAVGFNDGPLLAPLSEHKWRWVRFFSELEWRIYNAEHIDPPTLVVLLQVDPSVSLSRDRSVSEEYLQERRKVVMGFQKKLNNVIIVDGQQPVSEVTKSICSIIMQVKW